jgi:5-methylcytosine-specific restriction endonuclease McrA
VFAVREKGVNGTSTWKRLVEISDIPIRRHVKIRSKANPYDPKWEGYFEAREQRATAREFRGSLRKLWRRQKGSCLVCRQQINSDTRWNVHYVVRRVFGGSDRADNLALLHPDCHRQVHSRRTTVVHRVLANSAFEGLERDAFLPLLPLAACINGRLFALARLLLKDFRNCKSTASSHGRVLFVGCLMFREKRYARRQQTFERELRFSVRTAIEKAGGSSSRVLALLSLLEAVFFHLSNILLQAQPRVSILKIDGGA